MKKRWLIGVGFLALTGCTPGLTNDMLAGALGGSMGGPIGGLASVAAVQPLPQGWEWQQPSSNDAQFNPFTYAAAQNQQLLDSQNWQALNSEHLRETGNGLIPPSDGSW